MKIKFMKNKMHLNMIALRTAKKTQMLNELVGAVTTPADALLEIYKATKRFGYTPRVTRDYRNRTQRRWWLNWVHCLLESVMQPFLTPATTMATTCDQKKRDALARLDTIDMRAELLQILNLLLEMRNAVHRDSLKTCDCLVIAICQRIQRAYRKFKIGELSKGQGNIGQAQ